MLNNTTGFRNTAVGDVVSGYAHVHGLDAGFSLNSGEAGNIDIDSSGVAGDTLTTRIGTLQENIHRNYGVAKADTNDQSI